LSLLALTGITGACADDDDDDACAPTDPTCAPAAAAPLTVVEVRPADGTHHVDPAGAVIVTFSRAVQAASVTPNSVAVGTAQGTRSVRGATVTFTPSAPLSVGTSYQVLVQGVRALDGALGTPFTSSFTTRAAAVCVDCPPTSFSRGDVEAQGKVTPTPQGFTVEGSLSFRTSDGRQITFTQADVDVRFDANGRLHSLSGKVVIPSPHERITFAEPVRADVGIFPGRFLNQQRALGIPLKDDTDYFVFDFATALRMAIATGQTGAAATKPITVQAPIGGRLLMVVDYNDPMYYVYGEQDVLGAAGIGWSAKGRIPFVP
jgi:hypothetical protein